MQRGKKPHASSLQYFTLPFNKSFLGIQEGFKEEVSSHTEG